jgi:hypothetical protein
VLLALAPVAGGQVRLGAAAGYSMLETREGVGAGSFVSEGTAGRSWLLAGVVDVRFGEPDYLTFDVSYGPYGNDVQRSCYRPIGKTSCDLTLDYETVRALTVGVQYVRTLGNHRGWLPYLGVGPAIKAHWIRDVWSDEQRYLNGAFALSFSAGAERTGRLPMRFELRTVYLTDHPFVQESHPLELQVRASVLLTRFGGFHR